MGDSSGYFKDQAFGLGSHLFGGLSVRELGGLEEGVRLEPISFHFLWKKLEEE